MKITTLMTIMIMITMWCVQVCGLNSLVDYFIIKNLWYMRRKCDNKDRYLNWAHPFLGGFGILERATSPRLGCMKIEAKMSYYQEYDIQMIWHFLAQPNMSFIVRENHMWLWRLRRRVSPITPLVFSSNNKQRYNCTFLIGHIWETRKLLYNQGVTY